MQSKVLVIFTFGVVLFKAVYTKPLVDEYVATEVIPSCPSPIYCQGELLDTVQRAEIFKDSKFFVDMSLVNSVSDTLDNFRKFLNDTDNNPSKEQVAEFVKENFISCNDIVSWTPTDFNSDPSFLSKINSSDVRQFAKALINIWPILGRQISSDAATNPDQHSILQIPNGFIVPGGRFRELYYWDTYWIIKGLLVSEMHETVKGMLENFCHIINQYGFIPNGARLYYLNRSQPPLFALMVKRYMESTGNLPWLTENIDYIEKELTFWLKNRTLIVEKDGINYQLAHYGPESNTPRPESYKEDVKTCGFYNDDKQKICDEIYYNNIIHRRVAVDVYIGDISSSNVNFNEYFQINTSSPITVTRLCYRALKSGAESGWDFSSRWLFDENGGTKTNLTSIDTPRVIPVDLNSILCRAFKELSNFYNMLGNDEKYIEWLEWSELWKKSIEMVFYNEEDGIWYDYDSQLQKQRKYFYPSNFAPLWAETYDEDRKDYHGRNAAAYFIREGVHRYQGGIPTSLDNTGEQWDFTNAWPPLQEFVILGLLKTENINATNIANLFALRWLYANMKGFDENQIMFEKYDAVEPGKFGGGGEYTVQAGFGWTNGVVLSIIEIFFTNKN